ncbi:MAG: hypothetical protein NW223_10390 [Hyphomicrobiaceae bacterium]|nr:hypothetical protein [Hyphomicrobiaceae bacterium]
MILRAATFAAGALLLITAALAAADIPTRYSGAFPSTRNISAITGTFTGAALSLRGTGRRGGTVVGQYSCAKLSATQTRCSGTLKTPDGSYSDKHFVTITWAAGQPVAMAGNH